MSRLEDDISRVMAGHDNEAPGAADLLRALERAVPPRRRPGWYAPFMVAAAVIAVVAGSAWAGGLLGGHQRAPATTQGRPVPAVRLSCPASYAHQAPWVPAKPARVDGRSRLVPQFTPTSALICAYRGSNTARQQAGWALSGQRPLAGGLASLAGQLTWQPRRSPSEQIVCTDVGGRQINYLIGLAYPSGAMIWVAATDEPNECVSASNGEFASSGVIGPEVSKAFASGRWPVRPPLSCAGPHQEVGRLGQDEVMVPPGSTSVTICAPKAHTLASGYQSLISALNRLPTRPSTHSCSGTPSPSPSYQLFFSYPEGPPIMVSILIGCRPAIDNDDLQANSASSVMPVIQQLLKPK